MSRISVVLGLGLCAVLCLASCKSSESAYKKAYEKAKQQEAVETASSASRYQGTASTTPVTTPVNGSAASTKRSTSVPSDVRQERVTVVAGGSISSFNVVCGSFGVKANAENLKAYLDNAGYSARILFNAERNMYRVIMGTYETRDEAVEARDAFKARYSSRTDFQSSWLLYNAQ